MFDAFMPVFCVLTMAILRELSTMLRYMYIAYLDHLGRVRMVARSDI